MADDTSSCSESTSDVFFEMLGLPVMDVGAISAAVEDDSHVGTNVQSKGPLSNKDASKLPKLLDYRTDLSLVNATHKQPSVSLLQVPLRCSRYLHKPSTVAAFVIENLISASECKTLIRLAEELSIIGFHYVEEASHTDNEGITHKVLLQKPNQHKLSVFEHEATVSTLWKYLEPVILPHVSKFIRDTNSGQPLGLNPRLRVLRYDAVDNDVFDPHFDATTRVTAKDSSIEMTSLLTVLIYLNDGGGRDFGGGETYYLDATNASSEPTKVVPSIGSVVVFEHDLFHSSMPLTFGTKFVLRTDILFKLDDEAGVDKPRRVHNEENQQFGDATTLLDLCNELAVNEDNKARLSEMGMIDLTLESLVAPGMTAVKQMLVDVLDEVVANMIINTLVSHYLQN